MIRYLSVCSGIEAASVAWRPLEWIPRAFAEIEDFPSAVLAARHPGVPNWGDLARWENWPDATVDVLTGGTPCQAFSTAGKRRGLDDARGRLMFDFLGAVGRYRPRWVLWENVPGVLQIDAGRAFAALLGGLVERGYGVAWRVLDARYFGTPQRRRRVFALGHRRDWRIAAEALFEPESLRRDPPAREAAWRARSRDPRDAAPPMWVADNARWSSREPIAPTLTTRLETMAFAWELRGRQGGARLEGPSPVAGALCAAQGGSSNSVLSTPGGFRRLTPRECERLQGFPDDYTAIAGATPAKRRRALGNSQAVPVMRWIAERILAAERVAAEPVGDRSCPS